MIISQDINPDLQIYHSGAQMLNVMKSFPDRNIDLLDLFELLNSQQQISMNSYILTLDWLFLLGAVDQDKGHIIKCF